MLIESKLFGSAWGKCLRVKVVFQVQCGRQVDTPFYIHQSINVQRLTPWSMLRDTICTDLRLLFSWQLGFILIDFLFIYCWR